MMSNQWQDKLRNGRPVKITRRIADGLYVLEGEVTASDGGTMIMTWTKDGQHVYGKESDYDLIPLEAPAEASVEPDARKALAEAARAYKLASDEEEAAHAAEREALGELNVLLQDFGGTATIRIDGEIYRVEMVDDYEVEFTKIEVL
jgi:hypothetical protein